MKRWLIEKDGWFPLVMYAVLLVVVAAVVITLDSGDSSDSHNHHPITVIERKVDRIKAKQSAQIAADRRTLHQLTRAMELLP